MKACWRSAGKTAAVLLSGAVSGCNHPAVKQKDAYGQVAAFLKQHTDAVELADASGQARLIVAPAWQGRVMTSTDGGPDGLSYGWVNQELIASGEKLEHFNPLGGEDRIWIAPEGGQFSVFFAPGSDFSLENWYTPPELDTEPFNVVKREKDHVTVQRQFKLKNYSGTVFDICIDRTIRLLSGAEAWEKIGQKPSDRLSLVAYESINSLRNIGQEAWSADKGLLAIWSMGMFNASPDLTVAVPFKPGSESERGIKINPDYFGRIPPERLTIKDDIAYFRVDGKFRSKIGVSRHRVKPVAGGYDAKRGVLTIVQFTVDEKAERYVNSQWKLQENPYDGDVFNSYNDNGELGSFYELESLSPAKELRPGEALEHVHRTMHLRGERSALDAVARAVLGVGLDQIEQGLPSSEPAE